MTEFVPKIGLEVHVQLSTQTKLFCGCKISSSSDAPNSVTCPVCLGLPGSKPVLNEKAVEFAVMVGLAVNGNINSHSFFSRKTYFYPDLSKNFQITQFELPIISNGFILLKNGKKIFIRRIHVEEDPAKLIHSGSIAHSDSVLIDYNRSGTPLIEIVTEPDFASAVEAREFLDNLIGILKYLKVFDFLEGTLKADCNVSLNGGSRVEVKNINGLVNVQKAIEAEIARQKDCWSKKIKINQETRAFDESKNSTILLRSKESEEDYGYIFEPDLPLLDFSDSFISNLKKKLPELPSQKIARFVSNYGLKECDAFVLSAEPKFANLFENLAKKVSPILAADFLQKEFLGILNFNHLEMEKIKLDEKMLVDLVKLFEANQITRKTLKDALIEYLVRNQNPVQWVQKNNLLKVSKESDLLDWINEAVLKNPSAVSDFKGGELKSLDFLIGQVMRLSKGSADAKKARDLLLQRLK